MTINTRDLDDEMMALNERQQTADEYEDVRPLTSKEEDRLGQLMELFDALGEDARDGGILTEVSPPPSAIIVTFDGIEYYYEPR